MADLVSALAKGPDVIVSIPTDPVTTTDAYRKAAGRGVKLVFIDNVPSGFVAGRDYVSVVAADNYGNGVASAHLMAQALDGAEARDLAGAMTGDRQMAAINEIVDPGVRRLLRRGPPMAASGGDEAVQESPESG